MNHNTSSNILILIAVLLGIFCGFLQNILIFNIADNISTIFIKLLKTLSLPIIFLSLVSSISGMKGLNEMKILGRKVFKYTFITKSGRKAPGFIHGDIRPHFLYVGCA